MRNKKPFILLVVALCLVTMPVQKSQAVIPIAAIIKEGVKRTIIAIDLMIQRLQNNTIWLQSAQKVLENKLTELKLSDIATWTERQRQLYRNYYDELWKVRSTLQRYQRVKDIVKRQVFLVQEYKKTWNLINQDKHFTKTEIDYMYRVYTGIINDSVYNLEQLLIVMNSFMTQMTDSKRLDIINKAGEGIEKNYADLKQFNNQNFHLSVNRAKNQHELESVRKLYGIQ